MRRVQGENIDLQLYSLALEQAAIIPEAITLHAVALHCTASSQCLRVFGRQ